MRANSATVGATDGNIIAAIMPIQPRRNQPRLPSLVHGPPSMPCISWAVPTQPMPATAKSAATSPNRARAAAYTGARPVSEPLPAATAITVRRPRRTWTSTGPSCLIGDAERVDPRALRLGHRQVRPDRVEHAVEAHRFTGLHAERDDVLDVEGDRLTDADAVPQPVVADLDRGSLDAEDLTHKGSESAHRSTQLPAEHLDQLVELLVAGLVVDVRADPPVSLRHHLGCVRNQDHLAARDVSAFDLTSLDVEDQSDPAEVVGGSVVQ